MGHHYSKGIPVIVVWMVARVVVTVPVVVIMVGLVACMIDDQLGKRKGTR